MISFSLADLTLLISTSSDLQEKLEKASEDLSLLSETLKPHFNIEYFSNLLQQCSKIIQESSSYLSQAGTLNKLYNEVKEDNTTLEQQLICRNQEIEKLSQDNSSLSALMEELKIQFEDQLTDMTKNTVQNQKQLAIESKTRIEALQKENKSQLEQQLVFYQKILSQKDTTIEKLTQQLEEISKDNIMKRQEIQLAEMAVQDLWQRIRYPENEEERNELWQTYSPTLNNSDSHLELQSQPSNQLNKKRSSLMQDLYESHLQYQQPSSSKFQQSRQTIEEYEEYREVLAKQSESTSRRVSPTSVFSNNICINCTLKTIAQCSSVSISTQTYQQSLPLKLYTCLKARIINDRIKKR